MYGVTLLTVLSSSVSVTTEPMSQVATPLAPSAGVTLNADSDGGWPLMLAMPANS